MLLHSQVIVDAAELFPDNWIYIHAPGVKVGRIQNYKNWSPDMVPDEGKTALITACCKREVLAVQMLVEAGAETKGSTWLQCGCDSSAGVERGLVARVSSKNEQTRSQLTG